MLSQSNVMVILILNLKKKKSDFLWHFDYAHCFVDISVRYVVLIKLFKHELTVLPLILHEKSSFQILDIGTNKTYCSRKVLLWDATNFLAICLEFLDVRIARIARNSVHRFSKPQEFGIKIPENLLNTCCVIICLRH